jgi:hypothetical protein
MAFWPILIIVRFFNQSELPVLPLLLRHDQSGDFPAFPGGLDRSDLGRPVGYSGKSAQSPK